MPGLTFSTAPRGYVRAPADAPGFWQLGNLWRVMATGHQTGGSLCFIDQLVTPEGGGPGVHLHPSDEGLYVASGHCTFHAGGTTVSAGAGSFVFVPRFTEHAFSVDAPGTQLLNFYLPAGFELFIMGFAHPAERDELPRHGEAAMPPVRLVERLSRDFGQLAAPGYPLPGTVPPAPELMFSRPNPDAAVPPYLTSAASSPRWRHDSQRWSVLADQARTDGSFSLFEVAAPAGAGAPPHLFVRSDVFYYLLDGALDLWIGEEVRRAEAGDVAFVPRGTPHARVALGEGARFLYIVTPAGFERVLEQSSERAGEDAEALGNAPGRPVDPARAERLLHDIGLRPLAVTDPFVSQSCLVA